MGNFLQEKEKKLEIFFGVFRIWSCPAVEQKKFHLDRLDNFEAQNVQVIDRPLSESSIIFGRKRLFS